MARELGMNVDMDGETRRVEFQLDRAEAQEIYANACKFARMGPEIVLDLIRVDPAQFALTVEEGREALARGEDADLQMDAKVVARIYMSPNLLVNLKNQAEEIMVGLDQTGSSEENDDA